MQTDTARGQKLVSLREAGEILGAGGIVAYPTETYYAVGGDALSESAVARIYRTKRRDAGKPLPLVAASLDMVRETADLGDVPDELLAFWPGPLTLVVQPKAAFPGSLIDARGLVAIRVTPHPVARELSARIGRPLTASSANFQGEVPARISGELADGLVSGIDGILGLGPVPGGGYPSTIVQALPGRRLLLLREGAIPAARLREAGFLPVRPDGTAF